MPRRVYDLDRPPAQIKAVPVMQDKLWLSLKDPIGLRVKGGRKQAGLGTELRFHPIR